MPSYTHSVIHEVLFQLNAYFIFHDNDLCLFRKDWLDYVIVSMKLQRHLTGENEHS